MSIYICSGAQNVSNAWRDEKNKNYLSIKECESFNSVYVNKTPLNRGTSFVSLSWEIDYPLYPLLSGGLYVYECHFVGNVIAS